jgi:menaquinone-dependent protoporphyrinogen oxidase
VAHILILFGTTDGHTAKIAGRLGEDLRAAGAEVDVVDAAGDVKGLRLEKYAGFVVAASVHLGRYQKPVERWVEGHASSLAARPSAFLSVCLAVLDPHPETQGEVAAIMERFLNRCGWRPTLTKSVAGALLYTRYGWLKRWMLRRIARKSGGDTDTRRDFEYTDWDDLRAFARTFYRLLEQRESSAA